MIAETVAASGMALIASGVAMLWYSTLGSGMVPVGIDDRRLREMLAHSQLMNRTRRLAGALIVAGVALQPPVLFFS